MLEPEINALQHKAYRIFFGNVKAFDKLRESQLKVKTSQLADVNRKTQKLEERLMNE